MDNKKEIEAISIVFENCESILIPYNCVRKLDYKSSIQENKDYDLITELDCIIENNGSIKYDTTWSSNTISPIARICQYNDICYFDIIYTDNTKQSNYIKWYYENDYDNPQTNKNQTSKLLEYNKAHIHVEPYIPKYTLSELFGFPPKTIFKDEENNKYEMQLNSSGKYINIPMTEKYINMKYTICN